MNICRYKYFDICLSRGIDFFANRGLYSSHTHDCAEIFYFISGKGIYHVEGSEYELNSGDILIMRPSETHYIEVDNSCDYDRTVIAFDVSLLDSIDNERSLLKPFFDRRAGTKNHYKCTDFFSDRYKHIIDNMIDKDTNRLTLIGNLILLLQEINKVFENNEWENLTDKIEYKIIRYINKNLDKDLSIEELCDKFYICRAQFCKIFKNTTGTSIGKYITKKRLLKARDLLLKGGKPTDVYILCGYNDYSVFYRAFVKEYGCAPTKSNDLLNRTVDFENDELN